MERVKKGYINIASIWGESRLGVYSVEFSSLSELENTLHKIELVLKGADVIEMPCEEEIAEKINECGFIIGKELTDVIIASAGALEMADFLKSKIVK